MNLILRHLRSFRTVAALLIRTLRDSNGGVSTKRSKRYLYYRSKRLLHLVLTRNCLLREKIAECLGPCPIRHYMLELYTDHWLSAWEWKRGIERILSCAVGSNAICRVTITDPYHAMTIIKVDEKFSLLHSFIDRFTLAWWLQQSEDAGCYLRLEGDLQRFQVLREHMFVTGDLDGPVVLQSLEHVAALLEKIMTLVEEIAERSMPKVEFHWQRIPVFMRE